MHGSPFSQTTLVVIRSNCSTLSSSLSRLAATYIDGTTPGCGIQNLIEALANIFAQKPQHMIFVLLEQNIVAPITSLSLGISQV
jgi:hypothetical protein